MLVIDLEFSGNDAERNSILSLGAVDFKNPSRTLYLECRVREGAEFSDESYQIHGLSKEYLNSLPLTEEDLLKQFRDWALAGESMIIMGHSPMQDFDYLRRGFQRYNMDWIFGWRVLDSHSAAWTHFTEKNIPIAMKGPLSGLSLDKIAMHFGLPNRVGSHNALGDAKLTAEVFSRMWFGKNLLPEFAHFPIPKTNTKFGQMY